MSDPLPPYEMRDLGSEVRRTAPAALRNVIPIGDVLERVLPATGLVLETSSGTGQHAHAFATRFPQLLWQPSDVDDDALASIKAWRADGPANMLEPLRIDASARDWPIERSDAMVSINMAHIAPWEATLGLLEGAARILPGDAPLVFYGPWLAEDIETAPSNVAFDHSLKARDARWGLRQVETLEEEARSRGFTLDERIAMPANNLILVLRRD